MHGSFESHNYSKAFTIVELLIVIVVVAILAAVTIVSYNGIQRRAAAATLVSDLQQASRGMEYERVLAGDAFKPSLPADFTASPDSMVAYRHGGTSYYCIEAQSRRYSDMVYRVNSQEGSGSAREGTCADSQSEAAARCIATTAYVAVRQVNDTNEPLDITFSFEYGERTFASVQPGRSATQNFNTRSRTLDAGVVTITVKGLNGSTYNRELYYAYDAISC